tara:strand:+ start:1160 stop:1906 length:747 start_codon:yes stop_codon:yes gene_type:complete
MKLNNKIAFVTGGSRGIGLSIVTHLANEGAEVIFTYNTDIQAAENLSKNLNDQGFKTSFFQMDVSNRKSVNSVFNKVNKVINKLDILVNNAGINLPTDFDLIKDEDWDSIIDVNLKGPFICCQEFLELLRKSNNASIINIGSISGQYGGPRTAHYAVSKAGLISLTQVVARFGAKDNIRCNIIAAGLISSEMAKEGLKSAVVAKASENILLKRFGQQDEVANTVVFLASDDSSYITAQTINVNGGLYF